MNRIISPSVCTRWVFHFVAFTKIVTWSKMMLLAVLISSTSVASQINYSAQSAILRGRVIETHGHPIADVNIRISPIDRMAITNKNGEFSFKGLEYGVFEITASHISYDNESVAFNFNDDNNIVHFSLTKSEIQAPPVIVKQSNLSVPEFHRVVHLSRESWEFIPLAKIADVLSNVPGLMVLEGENTIKLSIYGSKPRHVMVYYDGIPLNENGTGEADLNGIQLDNLSEISVKYWGIGGEVNFYTNPNYVRYDDKNRYYAHSTSGSYGLWEGIGGINLHKNDFSVNLHTAYSQYDGDYPVTLDNGKTFNRLNNQRKMLSSNVRLRWQSTCHWVDVGYIYNDSENGVPGLIYSAPTPESSSQKEQNALSFLLGTNVNGVHINSESYYTDYNTHFVNPEYQFVPEVGAKVRHNPEDYIQEGEKYGASLRIRKVFILSSEKQKQVVSDGYHTLQFLSSYSWNKEKFYGYDLLRKRVVIGGVGYGSAERENHRLRSGFSYQRTINSAQFSIFPELGYEWILQNTATDIAAASPSLGLEMKLPTRKRVITSQINVARTFHSPPFNATFMEESVLAVGNKNLRPEKGTLYSIGLNSSGQNEGISVEYSTGVNIFLNRFDDMIVWRRNSFNKYYPDNVESARNIGFEVSQMIESRESNWHLKGYYQFQDARNRTSGSVNYGKYIPYTPKHTFMSEFQKSFQYVTFKTKFQYVGRAYLRHQIW